MMDLTNWCLRCQVATLERELGPDIVQCTSWLGNSAGDAWTLVKLSYIRLLTLVEQ